jgi:hypothetical protein
MFLCAHHLVCGCCFTLRAKYFCAAAGRRGWPAKAGRHNHAIRELFLFTKLARLFFFLYKSCDFIMRMHFVIVQGTSFARN